jgi:hypothetical protein
MKRTLAICALIGAILVPSALAADPTPSDFKNSAKYCKAVRATKGVEAFGALYGTNANKKNAFGKCVSKTAKNTAGAREDADDAAEAKAAADCKKQQADDAAKFAEKYKNLGQCVKAQTNDDDD